MHFSLRSSGEPVKITSENTQSWQHRTGGSLFESNIQNSVRNDNLRIYLPRRWVENLMLALNVREAGAAGIAAIAATWWCAQSAGGSAWFWERERKEKNPQENMIWLLFFTTYFHSRNLQRDNHLIYNK